MFSSFIKTIDKYNLRSIDKKILLAVSGGVDSIVLLHLFLEIPMKERPQIEIAYINHQLREETNEEENYVRQLAKKYELSLHVYRWPKSEHPDAGVEVAARDMRYNFFKEVMDKEQIPVLMTAHHQDDQVETILMRLARGSSLTQLTGIKENQDFNRGKLIRPLLNVPKDSLYEFADQNKIAYFEDETNAELLYTRNRFRNKIIPLLKNENERFNEHVIKFTQDISDVLELTKKTTQILYEKVVFKKDNALEIDLNIFSTYQTHEQRIVLKELLKKVYERESKSYKTNYINLIQKWLQRGEVNTQLSLHSDYVFHQSYDKAWIIKEERKKKKEKSQLFELTKINEWIKISDTEKIGLFETNDQGHDAVGDDYSLLISKNLLSLPLTVRHRQPGDRMNYRGLNGTKKIKDIFIDQKIPVTHRDQAWLVERANKEIIWLIGFRKMNLYHKQETDKITYVLKYKMCNEE